MALEHGPDRISRYEIQGLLARGGMARVYVARDPNTNRMVVVKLLDATLDSSDVRDRFDREARSLASLSHPSIVHIYDYGNFQDSPFIVMEYIRGETLEEKIKRRAPMGITDKLRLMSDVCAGLAHAHASGIIHRDVKPANLMVDEDERLKIIDFGIARVSDSNLTRAQTLAGFGQVQIGTAGYMSPEQTRGDEIDLRTDVFSVGAVCYELLAYREAFPGATPRDVEAAVMRTPPPPIAAQMPELDPEIDDILARAMARNPGDRYQSVTALAEALDRCRVRLDPASATAAARRPEPQRPVPAARPVRPSAPRPTSAGRPVMPPPQPPRPGPQAISVDPTVLIDRASLSPRAPEPFEPTMVIERDDLMRRLSHADPPPVAPPPPPPPPSRPVRAAPEPPRHQPRPAADPTVMVTRAPQPPPRPAPSSSRQKAGFSMAGLFQPLLLLFKGGGTRPAAPASRHPVPGKGPAKGGTAGQGVWTRGTLIAVGMVVVAALFVVVAIQVGRWLFAPSGQTLTLTKPTGGTLLGPGLQCGTRGSECSTTRPTGEPIELTAEADQPKFVFAGFTGDCAPTGRAIMNQAKTCGATFTLVEGPIASELPLTIDKPTGGTVVAAGGILCGTLGSTCTANLPAGVPVTLRVQTDPGGQFLQFTGDCDANGETTMTAARRCSATFTVSASATTLADNVPRSTSVQQPPPRTRPSGGPGGSASTPAAANTNPGSNPPPAQVPPSVPTPTAPTAAPTEPPPTAPTKPAEVPITPEEHAKREITSLVKQYCSELETLKPERVEKLFPQIRQTTLQQQFRQYKSLKCTITSPPEFDRLDAGSAGGAQVKFGMKQVNEMKSGGAPEVNETICTMVVSRTEFRSPWLIDRVRHEAKPKP